MCGLTVFACVSWDDSPASRGEGGGGEELATVLSASVVRLAAVTLKCV